MASQSYGKLVILDRKAGRVWDIKSLTEDLKRMYKMIALKASDFIMPCCSVKRIYFLIV